MKAKTGSTDGWCGMISDLASAGQFLAYVEFVKDNCPTDLQGCGRFTTSTLPMGHDR